MGGWLVGTPHGGGDGWLVHPMGGGMVGWNTPWGGGMVGWYTANFYTRGGGGGGGVHEAAEITVPSSNPAFVANEKL